MTLDLPMTRPARSPSPRHTLDDDPYPHAPRLDPLKAILAKLEPPAPTAGTAGPAAAGDGAEAWAGSAPAVRRMWDWIALVFGVGAVIALFASALRADKEIAETNERAARLEKEAAVARLDQERLKQQVAWRRLAAEDRETRQNS